LFDDKKTTLLIPKAFGMEVGLPMGFLNVLFVVMHLHGLS